jgi:hypothetical protein
MKSLILTLFLLAGPAFAENDFCAYVGKLAQDSMYLRLTGSPFSYTLGYLRKELQNFDMKDWSQDITTTGGEIALFLTTDVYETPRYSGKESMQIAAVEYRNKLELECYNDE